jgi:hypothetical protein
MQIEATDAWRAPGPSWVSVGPPGVLLISATCVSAIVVLDAASRPSLVRFAFGALIWLVIAAVWFGRFLLTVRRTRKRMPTRHWIRWLVVPVVLGLVAVSALSGAAFEARLALSRDAMDRLAADVTAGGSVGSGWVGLYEISDPEPTANGIRYVIDDSGLFRTGFAYSPNGKPQLTDGNRSPLWDFFVVKPVGGGWWLWSEEWD